MTSMRRTSAPPPKLAPINRPGRMGNSRTGMPLLTAAPLRRVRTQSTPRPPWEARFSPWPVGGVAGSAGGRTRRPSVRRRGGQLGASEPARQKHADGRRCRFVEAGFSEKGSRPSAMGGLLTGSGRPSKGGRRRTLAFPAEAPKSLQWSPQKCRPETRRRIPGWRRSIPRLAPATRGAASVVGIDKSVLTISEPRRIRDKEHLRFVAAQACLVCGRQPSDAHHLRSAQLRALSRKVSDELPICPTSRSSAGMKSSFGAKSARSSLPSMPWIGANLRIEGVISGADTGRDGQKPLLILGMGSFCQNCGRRTSAPGVRAFGGASIFPKGPPLPFPVAMGKTNPSIGRDIYRGSDACLTGRVQLLRSLAACRSRANSLLAPWVIELCLIPRSLSMAARFDGISRLCRIVSQRQR
jgi:hypothetical protein